jgi:hypothetical protein
MISETKRTYETVEAQGSCSHRVNRDAVVILLAAYFFLSNPRQNYLAGINEQQIQE